MLCTACRRQLPRRGEACAICGAPRRGRDHAAAYSLVLPDGTRAALSGEITLGRAAGNQVRLDDPAVSRWHARLVATREGVQVQDLGSSSGTFLDGRRVRSELTPLHDGQRLRVGDTRVHVERERDERGPGRTVVVPVGATLHVDAVGRSAPADTAPLPQRPRLRSGWALKRLEEGEGERRFVLADLRSGRFLRYTEPEARLIERLDGRHTVAELLGEDAGGARRLIELLLELGDLGLLAGGSAGAADAIPASRVRRALRPRERVLARGPDRVERLYRRAGYVLFTRPALLACALLVLAGVPAFVSLVAGGSVRPFHVAHTLTLGGIAFTAGRFVVVIAHELGHALTLASLGRRTRRIGMKLVLVFPYAFVDTSEAWFEPRRRRIAVSLAGPLCDAVVAGAFSLLALALHGVARDISFQLALGAYLGTLLNMNPLLDRDGYHVLSDLLREPDLRGRARRRLAGRLAGRPDDGADSRVVRLYGLATLAWSVVAAGVAGVMALRFASRWTSHPAPALAAAGLVTLAALTPVIVTVLRPLRARGLASDR